MNSLLSPPIKLPHENIILTSRGHTLTTNDIMMLSHGPGRDVIAKNTIL